MTVDLSMDSVMLVRFYLFIHHLAFTVAQDDRELVLYPDWPC